MLELSFDLWVGAAFNVAVHAGNESGYGNPSSIKSVVISKESPVVPPAQDNALTEIPFDAAFYLNVNPDLSAAGYAIENARDHWITAGIYEGRQGSPDSDVLFYLQHYPVLEQLYGDEFWYFRAV